MKVVFTFILSFLMVACGGSNQPPKQLTPVEKALQTAVGSVTISKNKLQSTPKGTLVYSQDGVTFKELNLIDAGVDQFHEVVKTDGFKSHLRIESSDIEIYIPPMPCENGSFYLNAGTAYDGSQYDRWNPDGYGHKDGRSVITAAEKVISFGSLSGDNAQLYVCPDASVLSNGTAYGLEHVFLSRYGYTEENRLKPPYDGQAYFTCSSNHSNGISHPLLPRGERCEN